MIIAVICRACRWTGRAIVGKKGFPLEDYKCPSCGGPVRRKKGTYAYIDEIAILKNKRG